MKRTRRLALTGLMAAGGVSLTACDSVGTGIERAEDPGPAVDAYVYQSAPEREKGRGARRRLRRCRVAGR